MKIFTAPQHTRSILPPIHPTKSIAALRGRPGAGTAWDLFSAFWGMMAYYVSGMVYFYGISNYVIHMPISWKLVVINCFLITVVEDFLLCVMAAFLAKRIRALAGDMFQN